MLLCIINDKQWTLYNTNIIKVSIKLQVDHLVKISKHSVLNKLETIKIVLYES